MYVIAGLGNPERKYENTRHNIGFDVIDYIAYYAHINVSEMKHKALIGKGVIDGQKVLLVKPLTYMNNSGESLREIVDYYKVDPESEVIVIMDDIALEEGMIRVRKKGSAGGHNGLKSIIAHLGTENFSRIRMGVGEKPTYMDLADYVLGHFSPESRKIMDGGLKDADEAVHMILNDGIDAAMNRFNKKKPKPEADEA